MLKLQWRRQYQDASGSFLNSGLVFVHITYFCHSFFEDYQLDRIMKILALTCSLTIISLLASAQDKEAYILKYKDIAISEMHRTGIPASIKLAQAVLESSYGRSELAREANNHFGIKCGRSWGGDGYHLKDDDRDARGELVHSCFRAFSSAEESFIAHSEFLRDPTKANRYGNLFTLAPDDYKGWAYGLQSAGYATNPSYAKLLLKIIDEQHLHQYDVRHMEEELATTVRPKDEKTRDIAASGTYHGSYTIQFQNEIPYITLSGQDNVRDLARRMDIPVRKLVKYNETIDDKRTTLSGGERVYLQPMKSKYHGSAKIHVVEQGQSLEAIAHLYGIKVNALRKRNNLARDCNPAPGSKLVLRGHQKKPIRCVSDESLFAQTTPPPGRPNSTPVVRNSPSTGAQPPEASHPQPDVQLASTGLSATFVTTALAAEYTVQPKDTLYKIATANGLTVAELKQINHLTSDVIHPGQSLKVNK